MSAEGSRGSRVLIGLLLFAASTAYFASYARVGLYDDEGYLLEGVTRILDGQVIYRDFHHTYAPGRFYLFAALFRLFGEDLLVVRATWVAMRATIVVLAWLVARRFVGGPLAFAPALALAALPGPWHKSFFHFFLLAALAAGVSLFDRGGARRAFGAGVLVAAAVLFRQDVGVAALVSFGACFALQRALPRGGALAGEGAGMPAPLAPFAAGFALALTPAVAYFAAQRALGPLVAKVFLAGVRDNRANDLPFPGLWPLVPGVATDANAALALAFAKALYFVPIATFAAYGAALLARAARDRAAPPARAILLLLLGSFALLQAAARSDLPHLYQAIGLVYFPWAMALGAMASRAPVRWRTAAALAAALALPAGLTLGLASLARATAAAPSAAYLARAGIALPFENAAGALVSLGPGPRRALDVPRGRVLVTHAEAALVSEIGRFLEEHTAPGDPILTIPGFQLIYFLFDRRNPTPFPHVRRAFDTQEEEVAYIASIDAARTRYVLFEEIAIDGRPERRFAVYARRTMDWLAERYRPIRSIGRILVLERIEGRA
jgi:hypothetical protein